MGGKSYLFEEDTEQEQLFFLFRSYLSHVLTFPTISVPVTAICSGANYCYKSVEINSHIE